MKDTTKGVPLSEKTYKDVLNHLKKKNKKVFRHINKAGQDFQDAMFVYMSCPRKCYQSSSTRVVNCYNSFMALITALCSRFEVFGFYVFIKDKINYSKSNKSCEIPLLKRLSKNILQTKIIVI